MADYPSPLAKITVSLPDQPAPLANQPSSEPPANLPANRPNLRTESEQLRRESAMRQLVQQTRQANSLPLCSPEELASHVQTWERLLGSVPTHMLSVAWDRACQLHDWTRGALLPGEVQGAAAVVIAEDRERRDREASRQTVRLPWSEDESNEENRLRACKFCVDRGYAAVMVYCATFRDWRRTAYPCSCEATPINQRRDWPGGQDWTRDRDTGNWTPSLPEYSLRCVCRFCQAGYSNRQQGAAVGLA